jgi:hypothetical protein
MRPECFVSHTACPEYLVRPAAPAPGCPFRRRARLSGWASGTSLQAIEPSSHLSPHPTLPPRPTS